MQLTIFGDRKSRVSPGWVKETMVGIFGDSTLDATSEPGPFGSTPTAHSAT